MVAANAGIIGSIINALRAGGNAIFTGDAGRNDQMRLAQQMNLHGGISPQNALALSRILAYHPYNTSPVVQQAYLNQLKGMGYLPHQAQ